MEFKYLNEKALRMLIRSIMTGIDPQCAEDHQELCSIFPSFHAYVDTVVRGETRLLLNVNYTGLLLREAVSQYDEVRHASRETAVTNACALNRLAGLYEIPPVFTGDSADRRQVAAFCLELDQYLFENRRMKLS